MVPRFAIASFNKTVVMVFFVSGVSAARVSCAWSVRPTEDTASGVHPRNVAAFTFIERAASELHPKGSQESVRELGRECSRTSCRSQWQRTRGRKVGNLFIGCIRRRGTTAQTEWNPLIGGSCFGRTDVYNHPWILSWLTTPLTPSRQRRSGCSNDGRRRSRSEPQDVATAVARNRLEGAQADDPLAELLVIEGEQGLRLIEQLAEAHRARRTQRAPQAKLLQKHIDEFRKSVTSFRKWYAGSTESWSPRNLQRKSTSQARGACLPVRLWYTLTPAFDSYGLCASTADFGKMKKNSCELKHTSARGNGLRRRNVLVTFCPKADRHNDEACALYAGVTESIQILVGLAS